MVSLLLALPAAENTMDNTIDDADYISDWSCYLIIYHRVTNSAYSHSIVNKPFLSIIFNGLFSC
jgi:hypothetical protein